MPLVQFNYTWKVPPPSKLRPPKRFHKLMFCVTQYIPMIFYEQINYMCDATHHDPFGTELIAVNEVCKRILYDVFFFWWWLYNILWLVFLWCSRQMSKHSLKFYNPCLLCMLYLNIYVHYKLITARYVLLINLCNDSYV